MSPGVNRGLSATAALLIAAIILPERSNATGPFDKRLTSDQQIVHALRRLTFGARPGDIEEVRRIGLNKWIELQLHPEQIPENSALDAKLQPLETLRLGIAEVVQKYSPANNNMAMIQAPFMAINNLPNDARSKIMTGTAEERTAALKAMDPETRKRVLAALPPNVVAYTPEYKDEAEQARKEQQQAAQARIRELNPRLPDLLGPDQIRDARSGDKEKIQAVLDSLDNGKRPLLVPLLPPNSQALFPELRRAGEFRRAPRLLASDDLKQAKVFRAIYSNRQLEEVLVDFWSNHFNVDATKNIAQSPNLGHLLIGSYERDAIRPHVLGHFRDLLLAAARHPAMLYYLDNWQSMAPDGFSVGPFAPRRAFVNGQANVLIPSAIDRIAHGLNENYGREIMELHTLGVKGGYTQQDVISVARCFTGWTVRSPEDPEFVFAPFMHDYGEKTVLGNRIPAGGGEQDGLRVIDILSRHPSTAKFISWKLARHFIADDPPPAVVERMAEIFVKTDGDLRAVLEAMLRSPEFTSEGAWEARIKSPFELVTGAVRSAGGEVTDAAALVQRIADMGQPLYSRTDPNGYPDGNESWLSTFGVLARMNFAVSLASGQVPGVNVDASRWNGMNAPSIARALLGREASAQTLDAIGKGLAATADPGKDPDPATIASLVLGSPDFERR